MFINFNLHWLLNGNNSIWIVAKSSKYCPICNAKYKLKGTFYALVHLVCAWR